MTPTQGRTPTVRKSALYQRANDLANEIAGRQAAIAIARYNHALGNPLGRDDVSPRLQRDLIRLETAERLFETALERLYWVAGLEATLEVNRRCVELYEQIERRRYAGLMATIAQREAQGADQAPGLAFVGLLPCKDAGVTAQAAPLMPASPYTAPRPYAPSSVSHPERADTRSIAHAPR
jgi:hypothetical protein